MRLHQCCSEAKLWIALTLGRFRTGLRTNQVLVMRPPMHVFNVFTVKLVMLSGRGCYSLNSATDCCKMRTFPGVVNVRIAEENSQGRIANRNKISGFGATTYRGCKHFQTVSDEVFVTVSRDWAFRCNPGSLGPP
jgi:hypothetical protein